ncbi:hypothetical protein A2U01_0103822, partial [Trifolium medium]|nr:hypothetical protein [Trifolium medium]
AWRVAQPGGALRSLSGNVYGPGALRNFVSVLRSLAGMVSGLGV